MWLYSTLKEVMLLSEREEHPHLLEPLPKVRPVFNVLNNYLLHKNIPRASAALLLADY